MFSDVLASLRRARSVDSIAVVTADAAAQSLARAGVAHRVEQAASLEHDVDTPEDLAALWNALDAERGGAQRTRGALRQLERSGARAALDAQRSSAVIR